MDALPRLTAEQTAERLGVKLETLYAYVARGRLGRERTAGGSTFDPLDVERFAATRRRRAVVSGPSGRGAGRGTVRDRRALGAHRGVGCRRAVRARRGARCSACR